ncbi:unnamed protein product [Hydatigera taeniaeformis]|uniref:Uncharacterized protein n=1 Tax=Hydatigena taeniaeformis TaxID=6205 RepID=A0A0R3WQR7_HYDTA|nr:unnamed protein product [Hydatigera taeniaeformis]
MNVPVRPNIDYLQHKEGSKNLTHMQAIELHINGKQFYNDHLVVGIQAVTFVRPSFLPPLDPPRRLFERVESQALFPMWSSSIQSCGKAIATGADIESPNTSTPPPSPPPPPPPPPPVAAATAAVLSGWVYIR